MTGGSRGLGREMVRAFAAAGADIVIASRKLESCEELASEVRATTGRDALAVACHVGEWDQLDRLAEAAYAHFGRVDVLVNNAGLSPIYDQVSNVTEALYDKVLDVNLKGPFRLTALVGTRMAEGDGGSIINVSSTAAERPTPTELPYAGAKAALNAFTIGFARAFGPKVRVNCIQPGPFLTDMPMAILSDAEKKQFADHTCVGRWADPTELVGPCLMLASDAGSYVTGSVLFVDGGYVAR